MMLTEFVNEVNWFMREHHVNRFHLANALGITPGRLSNILAGTEDLKLSTIDALLAALNARVEITLRERSS